MNRQHDNRASRISTRLRAGRFWPGVALAACVLCGGAAAWAQQTNAPGRTDYDAFKTINDRNVFDATRRAHQTRSSASRQGPEGETVTLVGTLSSPKGTFAFFDSAQTDYRKALQVQGALAAYTVAAIAPDRVTLSSGGTQLELRVGGRMQHDTAGGWRLAMPDELTASGMTGTTAVATGIGENVAPGMEVNDVLRKLMQQREQELK